MKDTRQRVLGAALRASLAPANAGVAPLTMLEMIERQTAQLRAGLDSHGGALDCTDFELLCSSLCAHTASLADKAIGMAVARPMIEGRN